MKVLLIVVVFLCVWGLGLTWNIKIKKRLEVCEGFLSFLNFCKSEIRYSSLTVKEIVQKFSASSRYQLPFLEDPEEPAQESICAKIHQDRLLQEEQKQYFLSFFGILGLADEENSIALIEEHRALFEAYYSALKEESRKKTHLIGRLSFLSAVVIAVLLI